MLGGSEYRSVYVGQLDGTAATRVLTDADAGPSYAASGHLVYVRQTALYAQPFDPVRLTVTGDPFALAQQVATGPNMAAVSVSATGVIAYRTGTAVGRHRFIWVDRAGKEIGRVGDSGFFIDPSVSPDGKHLALTASVADAPGIWLLDIERSQLTQFAPSGSFPVWSADGTQIVFSRDSASSSAVNDLYLKPVTGAGREQLLLATPQIKAPMDWSPDGRFVLFRSVEAKTGNDLFAMSVQERKPFAVAQTYADEREGQFSPDGKWIALVSNDSGGPDVYVQPFPGPGSRKSITSNGGGQPRWRRDGRELFYVSPAGELMAVTIDVDAKSGDLHASAPQPLFTANVGAAVQRNNRQQYVVSTDGQRFLVNAIVEETATPISVILNWRGRAERP